MESLYNLQQIYPQERLIGIKERTAQLMWTYGIKTDFLQDEQKGLFLLGIAASELNLSGQEPAIAQREHERLMFGIRMVALDHATTDSILVDKWSRQFWHKSEDIEASDKDSLAKKTKLATRATIEAQFASLGTGSKTATESVSVSSATTFLQLAREKNDEQKSQLFTTNDLVIEKLIARLPIKVTPQVTWIVTTATPGEFQKMFDGALAISIGNTIILDNSINSPGYDNLRQHEFLHTVSEHSASRYLNQGLAKEPDIENNTDAPTTYSIHRLVNYYIDDIISLYTPITNERFTGAMHRKQGERNSEAEHAWHKALVQTFGLEGLTTYMLTNAIINNSHPVINDTLLDPLQAMYRLDSYHNYYKNGDVLPSDLYTTECDTKSIAQQTAFFQEKITGQQLWHIEESQFAEILPKISYEQAVAFMDRFESYVSSKITITPEDVYWVRRIRKLVWLKKGLPLLEEAVYMNTSDREAYRECYYVFRKFLNIDQDHTLIRRKNNFTSTNFTLETGSEPEGNPFNPSILFDKQSPLSNIAKKSIAHLNVIPGEVKEQAYKSLVATLSFAIAEDSFVENQDIWFSTQTYTRLSLTSDTWGRSGNDKIAMQVILFHHKRMMGEENGNISRVIERMEQEILPGFLRSNSEFLIEHDNPVAVYNLLFSPKTDVIEPEVLYETVYAARAALGLSTRLPKSVDGNLYSVPFPRIALDKEEGTIAFKYPGNSEFSAHKYRLSKGNNEILQKNILLFTYKFLENQIQYYDRQINFIKQIKNYRGTEEFFDINTQMRKSIRNGDAHFAMYKFYACTLLNSIPKNIELAIMSDKELEDDLLLKQLSTAFQKPIDLHDIPHVEETLSELVEGLKDHIGEEKALRIKTVLSAGCKLK